MFKNVTTLRIKTPKVRQKKAICLTLSNLLSNLYSYVYIWNINNLYKQVRRLAETLSMCIKEKNSGGQYSKNGGYIHPLGGGVFFV